MNRECCQVRYLATIPAPHRQARLKQIEQQEGKERLHEIAALVSLEQARKRAA